MSTFNDHDVRVAGYHADDPGVLYCSLPRGLCPVTKGSGIEGVPDLAQVRFWSPETQRECITTLVDEGPANWAEAGTGVPGSAVCDTTPAVHAALGVGDNARVRFRIIGGAGTRKGGA